MQIIRIESVEIGHLYILSALSESTRYCTPWIVHRSTKRISLNIFMHLMLGKRSRLEFPPHQWNLNYTFLWKKEETIVRCTHITFLEARWRMVIVKVAQFNWYWSISMTSNSSDPFPGGHIGLCSVQQSRSVVSCYFRSASYEGIRLWATAVDSRM